MSGDSLDEIRKIFEMNGGKLGGLPAEVIVTDDQGNPEVGKQTADRMIKRDRVDFLTGIVLSNVLLAVQEIGKGRMMAFTSDTTSSWGRDFETTWGEKISPNGRLTEYNCDSRYFRSFWVNAVRWLAAARGWTAEFPALRIYELPTVARLPWLARPIVYQLNRHELRTVVNTGR